MEEVASLWGPVYQEPGVDDLKQMLISTTQELADIREKAEEEMRKNEKSINQLLQLLKLTSLQRDEARGQLQMLLNKLVLTEPGPVTAHLQPESPSIKPTRGNSGITDSDSFSDTSKHPSYVSSPMNSFIDPSVSSPDLSSINMADSGMGMQPQAVLPVYNTSVSVGFAPSVAKFDQASVIIDHLVAKKSLPEKGKLIQAVMGAGPLLKDLLVSGPLPQWKNPPPIQPFHMPPVAVKCPNAISKPNYMFQTSPDAFHFENTTMPSQVYSASALNYSGMSGMCNGKRPLLSNYIGNYQTMGKRQRSQ